MSGLDVRVPREPALEFLRERGDGGGFSSGGGHTYPPRVVVAVDAKTGVKEAKRHSWGRIPETAVLEFAHP